MSDLDRTRAARLMTAADLDALVLFQPEAFRYATGLHAGVAAMWRRGGAAAALVPADSRAPMAAIIPDHALHFGAQPALALELVTHPIWIDYVDYTHLSGDPLDGLTAAYRTQGLNVGCFAPRPETFCAETVFGLVRELLQDRGLDGAVIGTDLEFLPAADFARLQALTPGVTWRDGSEVLRRLRCIKNAREIACLRQASEASEAGMVHMASHARPGMTRADLDALWQSGVDAHAAEARLTVTGVRYGIAVGPNLASANPVLNRGDLVKADMGVAIDGYLSDGTRTYCMGPVPDAAARIYAVLTEAFAAGAEALKPGNTMGDVHASVLRTTRRLGLQDYQRGHFGHSIGASCGSEEWPFLSAGNEEVIEPGMVLAFETPFYAHGLGALMIEDQFLITRDGAQSMNTLPRHLVEMAHGSALVA